MAKYTELQDAIIEMQEQLESLTENLNKTQQELKKLKGWKGSTPELDDEFYFISGDGRICFRELSNGPLCRGYLESYNYFKTKEEGEAELDRMVTHRRLQKIANRLNGEKEIDWSNFSQVKYAIVGHYNKDKKKVVLYQGETFAKIHAGVIYCLSSKFLDLAIQDIGEEELENFVLNRR